MPYTTNPTVIQSDVLSDGRRRVNVEFLGTGGDPRVERERFLEGTGTPADDLIELRRWAIGEAATLTKRAASVVTIPTGTVLDLTPIPAPAKTPLQVLEDDLVLKLRRHREAQKAVAEQALTAADNQVVNRKNDFVAAFEAVRNAAGSNLNHALEFLL